MEWARRRGEIVFVITAPPTTFSKLRRRPARWRRNRLRHERPHRRELPCRSRLGHGSATKARARLHSNEDRRDHRREVTASSTTRCAGLEILTNNRAILDTGRARLTGRNLDEARLAQIFRMASRLARPVWKLPAVRPGSLEQRSYQGRESCVPDAKSTCRRLTSSVASNLWKRSRVTAYDPAKAVEKASHDLLAPSAKAPA